jgi:GNAT superfamily N-acetyltransferase
MVHVADDDARVVGYVFAGIEPENWKELRDEAGFIHDLIVEDVRRHAGVGRTLIASALDWLGARGVTRVMLWTAHSNVDARRFFLDIGFRPTMIEMTLDRERRDDVSPAGTTE